MPAILDQLRLDHVNVSRMLTLIERLLTDVHAMKSVDFELMRDVMRYMTHYPDRFHHPMEDAMIGRMIARDPATEAAVAVITREHVGLAEKGAAFRDVLERVVDGAIVERADLEAHGRDYAAFLRDHMSREDERVFPLAEATLDEADWEAVAASIEAQTDPVFGPIVAEDFERLLRHIRDSQPL